jgi:hypothetical protein
MEDDFIIASKTLVLILVHTNTFLLAPIFLHPFLFTHTSQPLLGITIADLTSELMKETQNYQTAGEQTMRDSPPPP